jgi:hypothetical protein
VRDSSHLQLAAPVNIFLLEISSFIGSVLIGFLLSNLLEWYLEVKLQPRIYLFRLVNSIITTLGLIICLRGGTQIYWKLIYYPVDIIGNSAMLNFSNKDVSGLQRSIKLFQREMEKDTTNRRKEQEHISIRLLAPIEKFKRDIRLQQSAYRASLLTREKEAEIAYKYNQYPINKISSYLDKACREMVTPTHLTFSPQQEYELQLLRKEWISKSNLYLKSKNNRGKNTSKLTSSFAQAALFPLG